MITNTLTLEAPSVPALSSARRPGRAVPLSWLLTAQAPFVFVYGLKLWEKPHYQFFPLAVVAVIWLAYACLRRGAELVPGRPRMARGLVFSALALQFAALLYHSYWLIGPSLLLSFVSFVYAAGGWLGVWRCWPSVALLGLCIPLPFALDYQMVLGLRQLTSSLGSEVLNLIRLPQPERRQRSGSWRPAAVRGRGVQRRELVVFHALLRAGVGGGLPNALARNAGAVVGRDLVAGGRQHLARSAGRRRLDVVGDRSDRGLEARSARNGNLRSGLFLTWTPGRPCCSFSGRASSP